MAVIYSDPFTYSDGALATANANWVAVVGALNVASGAVTYSNENNDAVQAWQGDTWPDDQYGQVAISGQDTTGLGSGMGICLRIADASNYYRVFVTGDASDNIQIGKVVTSSFSQITTRTQAWTDGDVLKVSVEGDTLKVYRNDVQLGADITGDAALASGDVGIAYGSTASGITADNFEGGSLAAAQLLNPSADSVDGNWHDNTGGGSLAAAIDETSFSDSDYIMSELGPSSSSTRVKVAGGTDPQSSTGHVIHWRAGKDATGGATIGMTVKIYQGGGNSLGAGTLIATFTRSNVDAFTTYDETLSAGEANSITDYTDLYLEFSANQT